MLVSDLYIYSDKNNIGIIQGQIASVPAMDIRQAKIWCIMIWREGLNREQRDRHHDSNTNGAKQGVRVS